MLSSFENQALNLFLPQFPISDSVGKIFSLSVLIV